MKLVFICTLLVFFCNPLFAYRINSIKQLKGDLDKITEIDFSNKGLIAFPEDILKCKNLRYLDLSQNGFVEIPVELSNLSELQELNLSENHNLSPEDLTILMKGANFNLKKLNLSDCALFFVPSEISKFKQLTDLNLSKNYLSVLPYSMMELGKMQVVNLSDNKLKDVSWLSNYWWGLKSIDVSGNSGMNTAELLKTLSFIDNLDRVVVSYLTALPKEFALFGCNELVIKSSTLPSFPRLDYSPAIKRLVFDNCVFPNKTVVVQSINTAQNTEFISLQNTVPSEMMAFLNVDVDSVDISSLNLTSIAPLVEMTNLSWLDIRGNSISQNEIDKLKKSKPKLDIVHSEPIQKSVGVAPPFVQFAPKPKTVKIQADKSQELKIGRATFEIPTNAFLNADGTINSGEVQIDYTEYFTPEDIFFSGINMTETMNGETFMLSSGGMFNFEVKDEKGANLKMNPKSKIKVNLASQNKKAGMTTYKMGGDGSWKPIGTDQLKEVFKVDQTKLDSIMAQDFYKIAIMSRAKFRERYVPKIGKGDRLKDFEISFDYLPSDFKGEGVELQAAGILEYMVDERSKYLANYTFIYDGRGDSSEYYKARLSQISKYCNGKYREVRIKDEKEKIFQQEGPNFISELSLHQNFEKDNFIISFSFKDEQFNLPVILKSKNEKDRNFSKFYTGYLKSAGLYKEEKENHWEQMKPLVAEQEKIQAEKAKIEEVNRQRRLFENGDFYKSQVDVSSISRSFQLESFGLWNCDIRNRMYDPINVPNQIHSVAGDMIKDEPQSYIVIDRTSNGVAKFDKGTKPFFDRMSKNVIIVFFTAVNVGVFRSWKNKMSKNSMEVEQLNVEKATIGEFTEMLKP